MKRLIIVFMLFFCSVSSASEISVRGGWLHTPNSNYDDALTFAARAEQPIYQGFSLGVEGAYHGSQAHDPYGDISGYSVLGELIYNLPEWYVKPYVFGGLGWAWWSFDRSQDMIDKQIDISLGNSFAKKVGIGANYEINSRWSINLEWHYFQSHVPKDSFDNTTGSFANVVTDEKTIGQEETNLLVGLRYKF